MASNNNIGFVPGIALIMSAVALLLILLGHVGEVGTDDIQVEVNGLRTDLGQVENSVGAVEAKVDSLMEWKGVELNGNPLAKAKLYIEEYLDKYPDDANATNALKALNGELAMPAAEEEEAPAEEEVPED